MLGRAPRRRPRGSANEVRIAEVKEAARNTEGVPGTVATFVPRYTAKPDPVATLLNENYLPVMDVIMALS